MSFELSRHFSHHLDDCIRKHTKNKSEVSHSKIYLNVKLFCQVYMEFWTNSNDSKARLSANTTQHSSEMELYIILATLENFECWN